MSGSIIVAPATPRAPSRRAVVRLSGTGALDLMRRSLLSKDARNPVTRWGRGRHDAFWNHARLRVPVPVEIWYQPGPHSYTGEDVVEIHLPGSPLLVDLAVEWACDLGARRAEPGEFTRRAFEYGRIDLLKAEATLRLIRARDEQQRREAASLLDGGLSRVLATVRDRVLAVLVPIELQMDFSDQDIEIPVPEAASQGLTLAVDDLLKAASDHRASSFRSHAVRVVLEGPANAGKSSLFNHLSGGEKALVAPLPGTTRDVIMSEIPLGSHRVLLMDTAGDDVEFTEADAYAHAHRRRRLRESDLVVAVRPVHGSDYRDARSLHGRPALFVWTYIDQLPPGAQAPPRGISNRTGAGIEAMRQDLTARLDELGGRSVEQPVSASQAKRMRDAAGELGAAASLLKEGTPGELVASQLRFALDQILELSGESTSDAVLREIFSSFCIGK